MTFPLQKSAPWKRFLALVRVREEVSGLEITDTALHFVGLEGAARQTASVPLTPGVLEGGVIKDRAGFVAALAALKRTVSAGQEYEHLRQVIVSVSSQNIYSQVFNLPLLHGEDLEKAVELNLRMASPAEAGQSYAGWQFVNEAGANRLEVLAAFVNRAAVEALVSVLREAGFLPHAIEFRALSITRLIREMAAGFNPREAYLALTLDSTGVEVLVIRHGELYFQYFMSWKDLYGGEKQISIDALEAVIVRNVHSVLNFYNTHWSELLAGIFVSADELEPQVTKILNENFSLRVIPIELSTSEHVHPNWYVALGTSLRGLIPREADREVSLLGLGAQDEFRHYQALNFLRFWRMVIPVSLAVLLVMLGIGDLYLLRVKSNLENTSRFALSGDQAKEVAELGARIKSFNGLVGMIRTIEKGAVPKGALTDEVVALLRPSGIALSRFSLQGQLTASLAGHADSDDRILEFKRALEGSGRVQGVNLPFSEIRPDGSGRSFVVSFSMIPPKKD